MDYLHAVWLDGDEAVQYQKGEQLALMAAGGADLGENYVCSFDMMTNGLRIDRLVCFN